jgi:hypothetical protein
MRKKVKTMKEEPCRSERSSSHVFIIDKELANREDCYCEFLKSGKSKKE